MLKKLTITDFKSIAKAEMTFGKVNLFIGANGSGKSNTLEAIGVLSAALSRDITDMELQRKGVRLSVPTLFKSAFKNRKLPAQFSLQAELDSSVNYHVRITAGEQFQTLRFFTEDLTYNDERYFGRSNRGITLRGFQETRPDIAPERGLWDRFRELIDTPTELSDSLNQLAKFCIYAPQTSFLRGIDIESSPVKPIGLMGGGLPQAAFATTFYYHYKTKDVDNLFLDIFELTFMPDWADEISIKESMPDMVSSQVRTGEKTLYFRDRFMTLKRNILSAYDSSEGSLYLLFLATLIFHPEAPKIFALDNVDNSLNPAATRSFLEQLISVVNEEKYQQLGIGPEQVFLTSHNPTSLDAFDLFNDDQRIFVVSRAPKSGFTTIERLQPPPGMTRAEWIQVQAGRNLSELWIEGLIPNALGMSTKGGL
ncbi:MAG: AAA family ATPase [Magnetococcales bacterium]|nr:AAA family ATPase [Magnetococcales bacterium]